MDDALALGSGGDVIEASEKVLILVVMDDALAHFLDFVAECEASKCLNPCCNG